MLNKLLQNHSLIFKGFLYISTVVLIVFLFPKGGKFKYDYFKGKPWQYENYYAPFNFAVQKSQEQLELEKETVEKESKLYFSYDEDLVAKVVSEFNTEFEGGVLEADVDALKVAGLEIIYRVYENGFIDSQSEVKLTEIEETIFLRRGVMAIEINPKEFIRSRQLLQFINDNIATVNTSESKSFLLNLLSRIIKPNVFFDEEFTIKVKEDAISKISYTTGFVAENELII